MVLVLAAVIVALLSADMVKSPELESTDVVTVAVASPRTSLRTKIAPTEVALVSVRLTVGIEFSSEP